MNNEECKGETQRGEVVLTFSLTSTSLISGGRQAGASRVCHGEGALTLKIEAQRSDQKFLILSDTYRRGVALSQLLTRGRRHFLACLGEEEALKKAAAS